MKTIALTYDDIRNGAKLERGTWTLRSAHVDKEGNLTSEPKIIGSTAETAFGLATGERVLALARKIDPNIVAVYCDPREGWGLGGWTCLMVRLVPSATARGWDYAEKPTEGKAMRSGKDLAAAKAAIFGLIHDEAPGFFCGDVALSAGCSRSAVLAQFALLAAEGMLQNRMKVFCGDEVVWDEAFDKGLPEGACRVCHRNLGDHLMDFYAVPTAKRLF